MVLVACIEAQDAVNDRGIEMAFLYVYYSSIINEITRLLLVRFYYL